MIRRYRLTTKRDAVEPLGVEDARGLKGSGWEGDPGEMGKFGKRCTHKLDHRGLAGTARA